jgi:hypothetical protein
VVSYIVHVSVLAGVLAAIAISVTLITTALDGRR